MSAHGRPEALIPSARREGIPMSAHGRPEALTPSAQREGSPMTQPGGRGIALRRSFAGGAR
jgi:hypothetical protein